MHAHAILLAALAAGASALINHVVEIRIPVVEVRRHEMAQLDARQGGGPVPAFTYTRTDAVGTSCVRGYTSLRDSIPTPTGALFSWAVTQSATTTITNPKDLSLLCATPTVPASLSSAYGDYQSSVDSWAAGHSSAAASLASLCGGQMSVLFELLVATDTAQCTSIANEFTTATGNGNSPTSSSTGNAGARETGMVAMAGLVAGAVGAYAAM